MNYSWSLSIFFILLLAFLAAAEYFVAPPEVYEGEKGLYTNEKKNPKLGALSNDLQNLIDESALEPYFAEIGRPLSRVIPSEEVNHLFHLFPFSVKDADFRAVKTTYFTEAPADSKEKYMVTYDIFSTKPRTIIEAYADVKNSIQKELEGNVESRVVEHNFFGQKSFSIKLEENSQVVYLVLAYRDRLLGVEYPYPRHDEVKKVFVGLFSH